MPIDKNETQNLSSSYCDKANRDPFSLAAARDQIVIEPCGNELFIDIDSDEGLEIFYKNFGVLTRNDFNPIVTKKKASRSGHPHYHITVRLPFIIDHMTRIALQACLGSDLRRELMSTINQMINVNYLPSDGHFTPPTLFFETPNTQVDGSLGLDEMCWGDLLV